MTDLELSMLSPYFNKGEKYANGAVIDWVSVSFPTMQWAWKLRHAWGRPVVVVRGAHPNRQDAVDFECVTIPLRHIAPDIMRVPLGGVGLYSAGSFHLDSRPLGISELPARWLAVRPSEEFYLRYEKLDHLIVDRKPDWTYLKWTSTDFARALNLVCSLSDINNPMLPASSPTTAV